MSRTASDARQTIIRRFLDQLASLSDFSGTTDSKPASSTELDNLLDSLNIELKSPLRLDASNPNDRVITVGPAVVTNSATTRNRSIPHVGTLLPNSFTSGTYTFPSATGGTIVASPGVNNTLVCPSGQYVKVLLYMDTLGLLNTLVGDPNAVEASATVLPAPDSSLPMGYVTIHNTGGTIDVISQTKIYQFGTGAGGGGSGDSLNLDVVLRDRFAVSDFEFLEENLFKRDQSTKIDGASTGAFSFAKSAYLLTSIGQTMVSYNLLDPLFLAEGVDIYDIELYLQWLSGFADGSATYEASRDGGTNWSTITMTAAGVQDYRGYLTFSDESTQQSLQTYANSNSDTNSSLTGSGADQARAQKFTVTSTEVLRSMDVYLNKTQTSGTVAGKYKVSIIRDSAGSPSLLSQDNISESDLQNASALSVGLNTVTITMPQVVMVPGDYWIVFSTDADYKASYSAAVRSIDVRSDTSPFGTGTPNSAYTFDGTSWTVSAGPIAIVYLLKGRVHDLRVRVTSGTATKYIEGYGVYYGLQSGVTSTSGEKRFQKFYFTGDSNTTDFTLTFTPDPELLEIIDPYRGQCYAIEEGVARIIGQVVRFEPNTFNFPGENIVLIFRQVKGSTIDNSNANAVAISTINSNLIDVGNQLADTQRVAVPMISVPYTTIVGRAQIPDPSQDLKPRLGIERIPVQSIYRIQNEFGAAGEPVFGVTNDERGLIRFVGNWTNAQDNSGIYQQDTTVGDYIEITFYGTGLNFMALVFSQARDFRISVDGGAEGGNIHPGTAASNALIGRNYSSNQILPAVSGLTLGTHTVKIRTNSALGVTSYGFEILNENTVTLTGNTHTNTTIDGLSSTSQLAVGMTVSGSGAASGTTISSVDSSTQITISAATTSTLTATSLSFAGSLKINPGISYNNGKKLTLASAQTQSYRSGFESGTLGTKGGRVLVYQKSDGTIGKAVTPTDSGQGNLSGASHTNEEIARTYHWREFGAGRTDDFSRSPNASGAAYAFTLDDGTTTLTGNSVTFPNDGTFLDSLALSGASSFLTITFVGTGLDIAMLNQTTTLDTHTVSVDGSSTGNLSAINTASVYKTVKIVSGLPYGTHTVKISRTVDTGKAIGVKFFIVYQPKKPTLPSGAIELADYNVMANYSGNSTVTPENISVGVLQKPMSREAVYTGSWNALSLSSSVVGGFYSNTTTTASVSYTFLGTGIEVQGNAIGTTTNTIQIDGTNYTGSAIAIGTGASWTQPTWTVGTNSGSALQISGLSLGLHTIKVSWVSGNYFHHAFNIITPIHSTKSNLYSDIQNTLPVGSCGISDNRPTRTIKELTTLPSKAWSQAVGITNNPTLTSTSDVPIPDLSTTIKINTNGAIEIKFQTSISASAASNSAFFTIYLDGSPVGVISNISAYVTGYAIPVNGSVIVPVAAGVHKIDAYGRVDGLTWTYSGTNRILTVREM